MHKDREIAIIAIAITIPLISIGIWTSDQRDAVADLEEKEKILVAASFYPLYEFTKEIGKERVEVISLVPFGIESHDWEPSVRSLQKMQQVDLIVINGAGFETWLNDLISSSSNVTIIDTSENILKTYFLEGDDPDRYTKYKDPHMWLNPVFAKIQVQTIASALIEIDPQNMEYYKKNANAYTDKLSELDTKIREEISVCDRKDFLAYHNSFSYFADEYGLIQHSIISGNDPHEEATPKTIEKIIQHSKSLGIDIIFSEEAIDSRLSEVIATEIGANVLVLDPIEIGGENTSYFEKMEKNLANLKEALCS